MDDVFILKGDAPFDVEEIRHRVQGPLREAGAEQAFLIGSYARGEADAFSDVDLIVVMPTEEKFIYRPSTLEKVLDAFPGVGVDILVYTPEEFARGMDDATGFFHIIEREGIPLL